MAISNSASSLRTGVCTSTTRPTAPYEGQTIYETDTDKVLVWNGSAWVYSLKPQSPEPGVWTSYTPTVKGGATTLTGTVVYAKYSVIGKTVFVQVSFNSTSAGGSNGVITVSYPSGFAPADTAGYKTIGNMLIYDYGTGWYIGAAISYDSGSCTGMAYGCNDYMGANSPAMTIASSDRIYVNLTYEIA